MMVHQPENESDLELVRDALSMSADAADRSALCARQRHRARQTAPVRFAVSTISSADWSISR